MHDIGNTFDPLFVSPDLYGVTGLTFAVVDDYVTPQAAVGSRGMSVLPGIYSHDLITGLVRYLGQIMLAAWSKPLLFYSTI